MDLAIKNGLVYNAATGELTKKDIWVMDGVIAGPPLSASCCEEIDASGCYVLPAIIDSHAHVNQKNSGFGTNADRLCIPNGVLKLIDAGSLGAEDIEAFITSEISGYQTEVKVLINAANEGQNLSQYELLHCENIRSDRIIELYKKYSSMIKGLKIRYEKNTIQGNGLEPLKKCLLISEELERSGYKCPITVHFGELGDDIRLRELLELLRGGDVLAHVFQGRGETIFDQNGSLQSCVRDAKERGILFDLAHGRTNFTLNHIQRAAQEGFLPDLLGTDIHEGNIYKMPAFSMIATMTMMRSLGMPLADVFKAVTYTPALTYNMKNEMNFFRYGNTADISIISEKEKNISFTDIQGNTIQTKTVFSAKAAIWKGRLLYCDL